MKRLAPAGTAIQVSARDDQGRWILSVLAKRTYALCPTGECLPSAEQSPLVIEPVYDEARGPVLEADIDVWPFKSLTDVVVKGHAYNHAGQPAFSVGARVDGTTKLVQVCGDRRASVGFDGRILFSKPATLETLPLSYAFAYGGRDAVAEAEQGNLAEALKPYLPPETADREISEASPFIYPRNPAGRGYVVEKTASAVEAAALPNLEHPHDLLTPERFAAGDPARWPAQPVPASLGWMDYGVFPRVAWLGVVPDHDASLDPRNLGETRLGYVAANILRERRPSEPLTVDGANGASLGLRLPHLNGGEEVEMLNLDRSRARIRFRVPNERPDLWIDGRNGKLAATKPVIHTVVIEPDQQRVTVTWRGCAPAPRAYGAEEIARMPFAAAW